MSHYLPIYISKFLVITNPDFYVKITTILYTKWVTPIGNGMEGGGADQWHGRSAWAASGSHCEFPIKWLSGG